MTSVLGSIGIVGGAVAGWNESPTLIQIIALAVAVMAFVVQLVAMHRGEGDDEDTAFSLPLPRVKIAPTKGEEHLRLRLLAA